MERQKITLFWFRRDLRLEDNAGLFHALSANYHVLPLFIFDAEILEKLASKNDARVTFIHQQVHRLKTELESLGSSLLVKHGKPLDVFETLSSEFDVQMVFCNRDYEPSARNRDKNIYDFLKAHNITFKGFKDQVIFDKSEVVKDDGKPYLVFTPYMRAWRKKLDNAKIEHFASQNHFGNFLKTESYYLPSLEELGFSASAIQFPAKELNTNIWADDKTNRDIPSVKGTSRRSLHLRFGTIVSASCF